MTIRSMLAASLGLAIPVLAPHAAVAQQGEAARLDSTVALLVGRTETARVVMHWPVRWAPADGSGEAAPPVVIGACLWADLPIELGGVLLGAGRSGIWPMPGQPAEFVVTRDCRPPSDAPGAATQQARAAATATRTAVPVVRPHLAIITTRLGPDTVGFVDRSTPAKRVTHIDIRPASRSRVVFHIGRWIVEAPISAR